MKQKRFSSFLFNLPLDRALFIFQTKQLLTVVVVVNQYDHQSLRKKADNSSDQNGELVP